MANRVIRTQKHVTIAEAHPFHHYVFDDRPAGNALVEQAYDSRCPRCRPKMGARRHGQPAPDDATT